MNIIIPLGGKGDRFKSYSNVPKPLITILDKTMIEYVLDHLYLESNDNIYIFYNYSLELYGFCDKIKEKYPYIQLIRIKDTKGAVETIYEGIKQIISHIKHKKTLILDCDTFYTDDIINISKSLNNAVFYRKNIEHIPLYSYISINDNNIINDIQEKVKISDNANTGAYLFGDINILFEFCNHILINNINFKGEPYTSCVISEMINNNYLFTAYELDGSSVISLGTPNEIQSYLNNTYCFLFDLDGTIVLTDNIYYNVWCEILSLYNISLTEEIYKQLIFGNSDKYILNTFLKEHNFNLEDLSIQKDKLFLKNIKEINIVNGIIDFIFKLYKYGHKICIVTNSNYITANKIIEHLGIKKYIDFIISGDNVQNGKPSSEPYEKAIKIYNTTNDKCIIFEDSTTGILSATKVKPKICIGVETLYTKEQLLSYGVDISIKDYNNINIKELINFQLNNNLLLDIKTHSIHNINNIYFSDIKMKGGFIADVVKFNITDYNNNSYYEVVKYETPITNNLSFVAKQLELYKREYYFYTNISQYLNIKRPKFINLIYNKENEPYGIVLEDLYHRGFINNINLNNVSIDVSLKIVNEMAKLHSIFWGKKIKTMFPKLPTTNDKIFNPFMQKFIEDRYLLFKQKWCNILNKTQNDICDNIYKNFSYYQSYLSSGKHITFIHGDIKSPNIFYDCSNNYEPYFIDWQHCGIGKGVQDLIFFIIESYNIEHVEEIYNILTIYYYKKLIENGITDYPIEEYKKDLYIALCYIPYFTSIWFGTVPQDQLIDVNFPYFFITKTFKLLELLKINLF